MEQTTNHQEPQKIKVIITYPTLCFETLETEIDVEEFENYGGEDGLLEILEREAKKKTDEYHDINEGLIKGSHEWGYFRIESKKEYDLKRTKL